MLDFHYDETKKNRVRTSGNCHFCKEFCNDLLNIVYYVNTSATYRKKHVNWVCNESCKNLLILQQAFK